MEWGVKLVLTVGGTSRMGSRLGFREVGQGEGRCVIICVCLGGEVRMPGWTLRIQRWMVAREMHEKVGLRGLLSIRHHRGCN